MEPDNLRTASIYINNLLLARGLLRNGQEIDFASPNRAEGGLKSTMGRIMSVVNDLILRRDRDAEQRESLSHTIRTLRAEALRQTTDFERLQTKHTEAQRLLGLAEATDRALKTQIRSAEQAARGLKEEMSKMRVLVGQTRAQCANEVRKRERVIEGLKKHVGEGGRARGSGKAVGVAIINVTSGIGVEERVAKAVSTDEIGYDLRMETNEFLTELARGLSEENENMGGLLKRTVDTLAALSGWERLERQEGSVLVQMDASYESLAGDIDGIIEHLRTLLTNPSFVPLEEVEVREDEIIRLREGWEKMEARWREAVQMMDGWRKRMAKSGQTVNLEELKMGLKLSPVKVPNLGRAPNGTKLGTTEEEHQDQGEDNTQADIDAMHGSQVPAASDPTPELEEESGEESLYDESPIEEHQDLEERTIQTESSMSPPGPPPQLSPLREIANTGNRAKDFSTIIEENTWDLAHLDQSSSNTENMAEDEVYLKTSKMIYSPQKISGSSIKPTSTSRLPRPASAMAEQSPLTMASIAAKLAATEREADAARVRAKLKAAKLSSAAIAATAAISLRPPMNDIDLREPMKENGNAASPTRKRKAIGKTQGGRASRRRSTLSPWELESLILGSTALSPTKDPEP